jgi:hypothetical protein
MTLFATEKIPQPVLVDGVVTMIWRSEACRCGCRSSRPVASGGLEKQHMPHCGWRRKQAGAAGGLFGLRRPARIRLLR